MTERGLYLVDDPGKSPVGEIRRSPTGEVVARGLNDQWHRFHAPLGALIYRENREVKGWPVIGQMPGTPAAEAKP